MIEHFLLINLSYFFERFAGDAGRIFQYNESIQLSLRLGRRIDQLDVVYYRDDNDVYIALYEFKSE